MEKSGTKKCMLCGKPLVSATESICERCKESVRREARGKSEKNESNPIGH